MQKTDNTTEHATAQDFFKFLGVILTFVFSVFFFFLKISGDSKDDEANKGLFDGPENEYDDLNSISLEATSNPMNANNIYDD